jgi:hypothetical protein
MGAGWRTCQVDVPGEAVSFERVEPFRTTPADPQPDQPAVEKTATAFVVDGAIIIDPAMLRGGAMRMLEDYCEEQDCGLAEAVTGLLNAMALERRKQLIDWFRIHSPPAGSDSTAIIREERDAR